MTTDFEQPPFAMKDEPNINTSFAFISMVNDPIFVHMRRQDPEDVPTHFIPLPELNDFIAPLLCFKTDPRQQYWYINAKQPALLYLGEHSQWDSVVMELNKQGLPTSALAHVIGFSQAAELLKTATGCLEEFHLRTCEFEAESIDQEGQKAMSIEQTYEIIIGAYNRGFGEAAHGKTEVEAVSAEEAQGKAKDYLEKHGTPDDYIVEVRLKK